MALGKAGIHLLIIIHELQICIGTLIKHNHFVIQHISKSLYDIKSIYAKR